MTDNAKFVITICVAFVVPALTYSFSQGKTVASINQLSFEIETLNTKVASLSKKLYSFNGVVAVNQSDISNFDMKVDKVDSKVDEFGNITINNRERIAIIESHDHKN